MKRIVNRIVIASCVAILLGSASQSFAANKVECSLMKEGRHIRELVATPADCTKLGGKVIVPKAATRPADPQPISK